MAASTETQDLKQRTSKNMDTEREPELVPAADGKKNEKDTSPSYGADKTRSRHKRSSMAKRGIRSLGVGIGVPLALTLASISLFGWSQSYRAQPKPFWIPPLWILHMTCLGSAFVMGLSAWLVWAEGGFHRHPEAVALYLGQLALSLAWDPIFFRARAVQLGLLTCFVQLATMASCSRVFHRVNPIAGDLVKLCLVWAGFLTLVNLYHVF